MTIKHSPVFRPARPGNVQKNRTRITPSYYALLRR
jgi:hypothetical protein